ncbi:hypothetical protein Y032_0071g610 [Ancylostoma ceylanicum]|uniref:Uncharacterized protein n=1 Tax=Ancylostoma ceylanicum TaxID=53326 RepID=A0A016TWB5_9BILA|nr:hypothetical protein Y032_0071g610 [Ancylostoma ceylanicum]
MKTRTVISNGCADNQSATLIKRVSTTGVSAHTLSYKRWYRRGGTAARALWLTAAPLEAAGNYDVSVPLVSAQQACCLGRCSRQPECTCRSLAPCLRPFGIYCM